MSDYKTIIGFGALVKSEASYNAGATLSTSTDGVQANEPPVMTIEYSYDGSRPTPPGTAGAQAYVAPTGETCNGTIAIELKGAGSAYSASVTPPNAHALLLSAGFSGSLSGSAWQYVPTPVGTDSTSVAMKIYSREESFEVSGSYSNLEVASADGGPAVATFSFMGLPSIPTDEALPAITYSSVLPPKASDLGFVWGAISDLKIRSFSLNLNREMSPRQNLNAASGSAGFAVGRRAPTMTITIEEPEFATFNPHNDMKDKTVRDWSFTVGSVANNKYTISGKGQIVGVSKTEDGPVATMDLEVALVTSTAVANDDIKIVFN